MIFLIEYDRRQGRLVTPMKRFDGLEWEKAANERPEIELVLSRRGVDHEVVLLESQSEEALRRTCPARLDASARPV